MSKRKQVSVETSLTQSEIPSIIDHLVSLGSELYYSELNYHRFISSPLSHPHHQMNAKTETSPSNRDTNSQKENSSDTNEHIQKNQYTKSSSSPVDTTTTTSNNNTPEFLKLTNLEDKFLYNGLDCSKKKPIKLQPITESHTLEQESSLFTWPIPHRNKIGKSLQDDRLKVLTENWDRLYGDGLTESDYEQFSKRLVLPTITPNTANTANVSPPDVPSSSSSSFTEEISDDDDNDETTTFYDPINPLLRQCWERAVHIANSTILPEDDTISNNDNDDDDDEEEEELENQDNNPTKPKSKRVKYNHNQHSKLDPTDDTDNDNNDTENNKNDTYIKWTKQILQKEVLFIIDGLLHIMFKGGMNSNVASKDETNSTTTSSSTKSTTKDILSWNEVMSLIYNEIQQQHKNDTNQSESTTTTDHNPKHHDNLWSTIQLEKNMIPIPINEETFKAAYKRLIERYYTPNMDVTLLDDASYNDTKYNEKKKNDLKNKPRYKKNNIIIKSQKEKFYKRQEKTRSIFIYDGGNNEMSEDDLVESNDAKS